MLLRLAGGRRMLLPFLVAHAAQAGPGVATLDHAGAGALVAAAAGAGGAVLLVHDVGAGDAVEAAGSSALLAAAPPPSSSSMGWLSGIMGMWTW
jgi:hypothetical protein